MNCYVFAAHPKTFACLAALKRFVFCFAMVPMCRALLQSRKPLVWLARLPHKDEVNAIWTRRLRLGDIRSVFPCNLMQML